MVNSSSFSVSDLFLNQNSQHFKLFHIISCYFNLYLNISTYYKYEVGQSYPLSILWFQLKKLNLPKI